MAKKKDKHTHKTNAIRIVEAEGIPYQMYEYDAPEGFMDGASVARSLGQDPRQVFKTLVTVGTSRAYYVCVIPVEKELDLKLARNITNVTGYIKGGCSPVGMNKLYPTAVDQAAAEFEMIMVSGGKVGLQMQLPVNALLKITGAELVDLTV